jgi:hypothetical protein
VLIKSDHTDVTTTAVVTLCVNYAGYDEEDEDEELQEQEVDELEGEHEYEPPSRSPPRTRSPRGAAASAGTAAAAAPTSVARSGYSTAAAAQQRGHYAAAAAAPATVAEALAGGKLAVAEPHSADIAALRKARVVLFGASNSELHGVVLGRAATAAHASVYLNTSAPYALLAVGSEGQDVHSSAHTVLADFVTTSGAADESDSPQGDAPSTAAALVLHYSSGSVSSAPVCSSAAAAADAVTVAAAASEPEAGNSSSANSSSAGGVTEVVVLLAPRSASSRSAAYEGLQRTRALPLLFEWSELSTEALCALLQAGSGASSSAADSVAAVVAPLQRKTDLQALQVRVCFAA